MNNDVFRILRDLGFSEDTFSEVIAVTKFENMWNCSPLGVKLSLENKTLYFYVYEGARILNFLSKRNLFTLNVVNEYSAFLNCIFKRSIENEVRKITNTLGYLRTADAYIVCENSLPIQVSKDRYLVNVHAKEIAILRNRPRVFNRVLPAVIEALICYTKIKPYSRAYGFSSVLELLEKIRYCKNIVYHATSNSKDRRAIEFIYEEAVKLANKLKEG